MKSAPMEEEKRGADGGDPVVVALARYQVTMGPSM